MVRHTLPPEHLALIRNVAYRIVRRLPWHVASVDDLVSAGYFGYREACERYDPTRGGRFESFAEFRIRGAMLDELRAYDHLSRWSREMKHRLEAARRALTAQLGEPPTRAHIAAHLGIDECAIETVDGLPDHTDARDDPLDPHGVLAGIVDDRDGASPFDRYVAREAVDRIERAVPMLSARELEIICARHVEGLYQREVADRIGVTVSRVCQIEGEALAKLRAACEELLAA